MFSKTISVFNFDEDNGTWYAHIIENCHVETDKGWMLQHYGVDSQNSAQVIIPCEDDSITSKTGTLAYLKPKAYKDAEDKTDKITFSDSDFFVVGIWEGDSTVNDADYQTRKTEGFYAYIKAKYDDVFKITSAAQHTILPHFEIVGA